MSWIKGLSIKEIKIEYYFIIKKKKKKEKKFKKKHIKAIIKLNKYNNYKKKNIIIYNLDGYILLIGKYIL